MIVPDTDLEILENWLQIWILIWNTSFWLWTMLQKIDFVDSFGGPEECVGHSLAMSPIYSIGFCEVSKFRTQRAAGILYPVLSIPVLCLDSVSTST